MGVLSEESSNFLRFLGYTIKSMAPTNVTTERRLNAIEEGQEMDGKGGSVDDAEEGKKKTDTDTDANEIYTGTDVTTKSILPEYVLVFEYPMQVISALDRTNRRLIHINFVLCVFTVVISG